MEHQESSQGISRESPPIRETISQTLHFAENILVGNYDTKPFPDEGLDPRESFVGPILDLNDKTLNTSEIEKVEGWIEKQLGAKRDEIPVMRYLSLDGQTTVAVYNVPLGQEDDKWLISRWQNVGENPSYIFWPEEMYKEQLELGYTEM